MKKSIFGVLAILIFNVFAGAALAVPMLNTDSGNDYFTASSITFQNQFENVGFEADFGLFSMA
ncbi:MAG: hypothetical protein ABFQ53_02095, partial [Patescibacteria group bacterium]